MCRALGTQRSWLEWLPRHLYCWPQGTNLWPLIYLIGYFLSISLRGRIGLWNVLIVLQCRKLQELSLSNRVRLDTEMKRPTGSSSVFMGSEPFPLPPSSVKWRERERLIKSNCASWRLLVVSRECGWRSLIQAWRDTYSGFLDPNCEDFGVTNNWTVDTVH
jgi:hypothetical protein